MSDVVKLNVDETVMVVETVEWDNVKDKPEEFPPEEHTHSVEDITDFPSVGGAFTISVVGNIPNQGGSITLDKGIEEVITAYEEGKEIKIVGTNSGSTFVFTLERGMSLPLTPSGKGGSFTFYNDLIGIINFSGYGSGTADYNPSLQPSGGEVIEFDYTEGSYPIGFPVSPQQVLEKIKRGVHLVVDMFDTGPEINYYLNVDYNVMNEDIVVYGISHSYGSNATMRVYFIGNLTTNEWTEIL